MFQLDRMAQNRRRIQGTGLVSCLYRKLTANNIGDLDKETNLGWCHCSKLSPPSMACWEEGWWDYKKECKYVCLVVSRRGNSFEKLGRREITSFGVFEIFLGSTFLRFNFFQVKKNSLTIFAPQNVAAFSDSLFWAISHLLVVLSWVTGCYSDPQCRVLS